jgi:hypothetical protein
LPFKTIQSVAADAASLTLPARTTTLRVTANDHAQGDTIYTWRKVHGAGAVTFQQNGTAAAKNAAIVFEGVPGQYLFEVKMSDSRGLTEVVANVAVTLRPVGGIVAPNAPPVATAQSPNVPQATPTPITLTGSDPEGLPLNFRVVTLPTQGTLTGTAPFLIYTPAPNYTGADAFTFEVQDSEGQTSSATASITIAPGSSFPAAIYEPFNYTAGAMNGQSGGGAVGLSGTWTASSLTQVITGSLAHGPLLTTGNAVTTLNATNTLGGSRAISSSALAAMGLLLRSAL